MLEATIKIETLMNRSSGFSTLEVLSFAGIQQEIEIDKASLKIGVNTLVKTAVTKILAALEREGVKLKNLLVNTSAKNYAISA